MDGRSIHENICDMVWLTNLRLLGLQSRIVSLSPTMFDHSNPTAFQQVFHALFIILSREKAMTEFRDCWPILDKRQEADFRRRVVQMLKDLHKEFPDELPFTNPSLFQSPGGRKFITFLSVFTSFIMKQQVRKVDDLILKPTIRNKNLRKSCHKFGYDKMKDCVGNSVHYQANIKQIETVSAGYINIIVDKYQEHQARIKELDDEVTKESWHPDFNESSVDVDRVRSLQEKASNLFEKMNNSFDTVKFVLDGGVDKTKLKLSEVADSSSALLSSYESLLNKCLNTAEEVVVKRRKINLQPDLSIETEVEVIQQMKSNLDTFHSEMKRSVKDMLGQSKSIDWGLSYLVQQFPALKSQQPVKLLPPTPSIVNKIKSLETVSSPCTRLNLSSPDPRQSHKTPGTLVRGSQLTPARSIQSVPLSRRFALAKDSEVVSSPDLKMKPRLEVTITQDQDCSSRKSSVGHITQFSPMLSSTTAAEKTFSELAAESSKHDSTQNKIEMYRKVLDGLKSKSELEDKSVLMSAWTAHRESLSPRTTKQRRVVHGQSRIRLEPQSSCPSPGPNLGSPPPSQPSPFSSQPVSRTESPVNDLIISRLDQLMTSLTLNENPSGLNVSLDDEIDLLSPHL